MENKDTRTSLFYFSGIAADLPLALLKHETEELRKVNEKVKRSTASVLHTIGHLVAAAKYNADGPRSRAMRSRHVRQIIMGDNF